MAREKKEPSGVKGEDLMEEGTLRGFDQEYLSPSPQGTSDMPHRSTSNGNSNRETPITPDAEIGAPLAGQNDDERKPSARSAAISAANASGSLPNFKDQVSDRDEQQRSPNQNCVLASAPGVLIEQGEAQSAIVAEAIVESSSDAKDHAKDLRKQVVWAVALVVGLAVVAAAVTVAVLVLSNKDGDGDARPLPPSEVAPASSPSPTMVPLNLVGCLGLFDESTSVCCPETCGRCGGAGCPDLEGGPSNCCTSDILENEENFYCSDTNPPPCVVRDCLGLFDESTSVCCPETCGRCGGEGCSGLEGGRFNCCTSDILENEENYYCSDTNPPPCVVNTN